VYGIMIWEHHLFLARGPGRCGQEIGWYGNVRSERRCDSTWKSTSFLLASAVL
jgi:hypothetical protein